MKEKIGIVGYGIVGQAVEHGFEGNDVLFYDKYKKTDTLKKVCNRSNFIFVCLPTPFKKDRIDLTIVEETVEKICKHTDDTDKIVVIKSTVVPGTTRKLSKKHPKTNFAFNPEFLTEANYLEDFVNADRHVVGADDGKVRLRLSSLYTQAWPKTPVCQTDSVTAEVVKYASNCFLATKVIFANEFNDLCENLGVEWAEVKKMVTADKRIGETHLDIYSLKGFGGKCLVPDTIVLTESGPKQMGELTRKDRVFDGADFTKITALGSRRVAKTISISAAGRKIIGSPDHVHLVCGPKGKMKEVTLEKVTTEHWLYIPRPKFAKYVKTVSLGNSPEKSGEPWARSVKLDKKWGRLIGLYLSKGLIIPSTKNKNHKTVFWSFPEQEKELANEVVELLKEKGCGVQKITKSSNQNKDGLEHWTVKCNRQHLVRLFEILGLGAKFDTKDIPAFKPNLARVVIGAWLDGVGECYGKVLRARSESGQLIKSLDRLLLSMDIFATITEDGHTILLPVANNDNPICKWSEHFWPNSRKCSGGAACDTVDATPERKSWKVKVGEVESRPGARVISVETKSGKYVANNILTHNCFPKDMIAILGLFKDLGVDSKMLSAVWNKNLEIRKIKDWEEIPFVKSE